jgi:uncharacterized protein (TIGR04255 family)
MNADTPKLRNAPIVEAVLDIDCDTPPGVELATLEELALERFREHYPKMRKRYFHEFEIESKAEALSKLSTRHAIQALQFIADDEKQLVQVRAQGFSFNRLAPYSTLDAYLPEIERTWRLYVEVAAPVVTRLVRLRYINRIPLPMEAGKVDLDEFLTIGPRMANETALKLTGFLIQQNAVETDTGHQVSLVLTAQAPEDGKLPVILDIGVASPLRSEPADWSAIRQTVDSLRRLKNQIFMNTLTDRCLQIFQ